MRLGRFHRSDRVSPAAIASGNYQFEADINGDGVVNLLGSLSVSRKTNQDA
jgi:hypothetical protein